VVEDICCSWWHVLFTHSTPAANPNLQQERTNHYKATVYYSLGRFFVGDNLDVVVEYLERAAAAHNTTVAAEEANVFRTSLLDTCQNLMGRGDVSQSIRSDWSSSTTAMSTGGGSMPPLREEEEEEEEHQQEEERISERVSAATDQQHHHHHLWVLFFKIFQAVYMDQFEHAESLLRQWKRQKRKATPPHHSSTTSTNKAEYSIMIFYEGLIAAVLAFRSKTTGRRRTSTNCGFSWRRNLLVAQKKLHKLLQLQLHDPTLCNKIFLLEGQIQACLGHVENSLLSFHKSVDWAERQGLSHEQGLAYELSARMCFAYNRGIEAELYLSQARIVYEQWGAQAKVEQLKSQ